MRAVVLKSLLLVILVLSTASQRPAESSARPPGVVLPDFAPADSLEGLRSDFRLDPDDGAWHRFSPSFIRIHFLNASLDLVPNSSTLRLDGVERSIAWSDSIRTVETSLVDRLEDGVHQVEASLVHSDASVTALAWSFGLDTHSPEVSVEPVPATTPEETLEIRGEVTDAWFAGLTIQGREVASPAGSFAHNVSLWPGPNDVVIEAWDLAGNLGRVHLTVGLETPEYDGALRAWSVANASFEIDLPDAWAAQTNIRLVSGTRADLVALAPLQPGLQTELVIVSETSTFGFTQRRALEWMQLVIASIEATGELRQVVGQPRIVDEADGSVAVQASLIRQTASFDLAFMQITMVWSEALHRQWVILASMDARRAVEVWPAVDAAVSSFDVSDEGLEGPVDPRSMFVIPTALVVGAIVALLVIAGLALGPPLLARRRKRLEGQWRPPKNWGF